MITSRDSLGRPDVAVICRGTSGSYSHLPPVLTAFGVPSPKSYSGCGSFSRQAPHGPHARLGPSFKSLVPLSLFRLEAILPTISTPSLATAVASASASVSSSVYRSNVTVEDLPLEILSQIFSYLTPEEILFSVALVSHTWLSATFDDLLFKELFLRHFGGYPTSDFLSSASSVPFSSFSASTSTPSSSSSASSASLSSPTWRSLTQDSINNCYSLRSREQQLLWAASCGYDKTVKRILSGGNPHSSSSSSSRSPRRNLTSPRSPGRTSSPSSPSSASSSATASSTPPSVPSRQRSWTATSSSPRRGSPNNNIPQSSYNSSSSSSSSSSSATELRNREGTSLLQKIRKLQRRLELESAINPLVNLETTGRKGETPLHLAAKNGHYEIVKALLDANANKEAVEGSFGGTPLFLAIVNQRFSVVQLLVAKGANIDATNWCRHSALDLAAIELKDKELVKHLLYLSCYRSSGVRNENEDLLPEEFSFFWQQQSGGGSSGGGSSRSLPLSPSIFLDVEGDIFREKVIEKGLLHRAVSNGNSEGTEALLEVMRGIETRKEKQIGLKLNRYVNSRFSNSEVALHMAARIASTSCLDVLIHHGADINM
jgi:ankyrin repeat protein